MKARSTRIWLGTLVVTTLLISAWGCSQTESSKLVPPTYFTDEALDQARDYVNQGYELLDSNLVDEAIAAFGKIDELIPNGLVSNYNIACAYGRTGNTDQAFVHLGRLVEAGYDGSENLKYDSDFESLRADPRWEALVSKAKANHESASAGFAGGMPRYDQAPQTFATLEECEEWVKEQKARMRKNRMAWTSAQYTAARIDLAAQKLTCLALLKADDAEFDVDLERIREAAGLVSMWEPWGGVADLVVTEVENLLHGSPSDAARNEALYRAGLAMAMKYPADDNQRAQAYAEANRHLLLVAEGTEFFPAAQTLKVVNQVRLPKADKNVLNPRLREVITEFGSDKIAYHIIATLYGSESVSAIWPIPIGLEDINGNIINIADYQGKVLLIDFWATWCGPCRAELPGLLKVYEKYHPNGFEIVSISLDYQDRVNLEKYREWIAEKGMNWRHTYEGKGWDTGLVKDYFVSSIPAPFMVGPDGSLIAWGEDCRGEKLEETVKKALGSV